MQDKIWVVSDDQIIDEEVDHDECDDFNLTNSSIKNGR